MPHRHPARPVEDPRRWLDPTTRTELTGSRSWVGIVAGHHSDVRISTWTGSNRCSALRSFASATTRAP